MICAVIAILAARQQWRFQYIEMRRPLAFMHHNVSLSHAVSGTVKVQMLDVEFTAKFAISEKGWYRIEGNGYLYIGNKRGYFVFDQGAQRCVRSNVPPDLLPFVPGFESLVCETPRYEQVSSPTNARFLNQLCKKIGIRSGKQFITLYLDGLTSMPKGWESKTANATVRGEYTLTNPGEMPESTFDWIPPPGALDRAGPES